MTASVFCHDRQTGLMLDLKLKIKILNKTLTARVHQTEDMTLNELAVLQLYVMKQCYVQMKSTFI